MVGLDVGSRRRRWEDEDGWNRCVTPPPKAGATVDEQLYRLRRASPRENAQPWVSHRRAFTDPPKGRGVGERFQGPPGIAFEVPASTYRSEYNVAESECEAPASTRYDDHRDHLALLQWLDTLRRSLTVSGDVHVEVVKRVRDLALDAGAFEDALMNHPIMQQCVERKQREIIRLAFRKDWYSKDECKEEDVLQSVGAMFAAKFKDTRSIIRYLGSGGSGNVTKTDLARLFKTLGCGELLDGFWKLLRRDKTDLAAVGQILSILGPYVQPSGTCGSRPQTDYTGYRPDDARPPEVVKAVTLFMGRVQEKVKSLRALWLLLDRDRVGYAERQVFVDLFALFSLDPALGHLVFDYLDADGSNSVSHVEFMNFIGSNITPDYTPKDETEPAKSAKEMNMPHDVEDALHQIGRKAEKRVNTLKDLFRKLSKGKFTLNVTRKMFCNWIAELLLPESVAHTVFDYLDPSSLGEVNFQAVTYLLGPYIRPGVEGAEWQSPLPDSEPLYGMDLPKELPASISSDRRTMQELMDLGQRMASKYIDLQDVFRSIDVSKSAGIERSELRRCCAKWQLSEATADRIFDAADVNGDKVVAPREFFKIIGYFVNAYWSPLGKAKYASREHEILCLERRGMGVTPPQTPRNRSRNNSELETTMQPGMVSSRSAAQMRGSREPAVARSTSQRSGGRTGKDDRTMLKRSASQRSSGHTGNSDYYCPPTGHLSARSSSSSRLKNRETANMGYGLPSQARTFYETKASLPSSPRSSSQSRSTLDRSKRR